MFTRISLLPPNIINVAKTIKDLEKLVQDCSEKKVILTPNICQAISDGLIQVNAAILLAYKSPLNPEINSNDEVENLMKKAFENDREEEKLLGLDIEKK